MSTARDLLTGQMLGNCRILEQVGQGGMGTVYRAYQASLKRVVAVKVISPLLVNDDVALARFKREAQTVASFRHPHILTVYDFGEQDGLAYLVTEFAAGGTLRARVGAPVSLSESIAVLRPIGSALDYAHARGIVHRDVKPGNVLIHDDGTLVLSDFGLALQPPGAGTQLTVSGLMLGTPAYMAPEQGLDSQVGPSADLYALGVIAYELLTGSVPFSGPTPVSVMLAHIQSPLPPARSRNPALSEAVESVLARALAKQPVDRYATAAALVAALEANVALDEKTVTFVTKSVTPSLESVTSLAESVTPSAKSVIPSPESVIPSPESVTPSADSVTPFADNATPPPASATPETPPAAAVTPPGDRLTPRPAGTTPRPEAVTPVDEGVTPQHQSVTSGTDAGRPSGENITSLPGTVTSRRTRVPPQAENVTSSLESVTPSLESVTPSLQAVTFRPETTRPPEGVTPQPESVTPRAQSVTPRPESVTPRPESVTLDNRTVTLPPKSVTRPGRRRDRRPRLLLGAAAALALAMLAGVAVVVLRAIAQPGPPAEPAPVWQTLSAAGPIAESSGLAIDRFGFIYVFNDDLRLVKLSPTGQPVGGPWGTIGGPIDFDNPRGLAVDANGNIFVTESGLAERIQKLTPLGQDWLQGVSRWGGGGSGPGQFSAPEGIAVSPDGTLIVADSQNDRIQKLSSTGQPVAQWGGPGSGSAAGQFFGPRNVALDAHGNVYVADSGNDRIQKLSSTGQPLAQWGSTGSDLGQFSGPAGLALDASGNILVADSGNDRIQKLSPTGKALAQWGTSGNGDEQLSSPSGIVVAGSGTIYVVDSGNHRIQKLTFPSS